MNVVSEKVVLPIIKKIFTGTTTETGTVAFDLSTYPTSPNGKPITKFSIKSVKWSIMSGFAIQVIFDRSSAKTVMILAGNGCYENEIADAGTGSTGDILFTSSGTAGTYFIEMEVYAKE